MRLECAMTNRRTAADLRTVGTYILSVFQLTQFALYSVSLDFIELTVNATKQCSTNLPNVEFHVFTS